MASRLKTRENPALRVTNGAMQTDEEQIIADLDSKSWFKVKEIVGNNKHLVCKHGEGGKTCIFCRGLMFYQFWKLLIDQVPCIIRQFRDLFHNKPLEVEVYYGSNFHEFIYGWIKALKGKKDLKELLARVGFAYIRKDALKQKI